MSENNFKPIENQEELDKVIGTRINKIKEKYESEMTGLKDKIKDLTEENQDYQSIKEKFAGMTGNLEEKDKTIGDLTKELEDYKLRSLKTDIALKQGLPYSLANRLSGDTEESILEDAKNLSNIFNSTQTIEQPSKNLEPEHTKEDGYKSLLKDLNLQGE